MAHNLASPFGRRAIHRSRLRLRADVGSGFYGGQQTRLLRIYLAATTFLFGYGVVFTLFPIRRDLHYANPAGGIVAIALGLAALAWLAVRPDKPGPAMAAAIAATPIVMAFHVAIIAEFVCLIAPMFLAMYLRAFYPLTARRGPGHRAHRGVLLRHSRSRPCGSCRSTTPFSWSRSSEPPSRSGW